MDSVIKEIQVKNYQSLYDVKVEVGKFTVIFGDSDVGKSAFYRAFRGLLTAESGDDFISKGTLRTGVSVITADGLEVIWLKSQQKSSIYFLKKDGKLIKEWRRARNLPSEIEKLLRFEQVNIDGDRFYPNLKGQFDPLFLLFESSSKRARVLGSLVSNFLLQGIKTANLDRVRNDALVRASQELADDLELRLKFDWRELLSVVTDGVKRIRAVKNNIYLYTDLKKQEQKREIFLKYKVFCDIFIKDAEKILPGMKGIIEDRINFQEIQKFSKKRVSLLNLVGFKPILVDKSDLDSWMRLQAVYDLVFPLYMKIRVVKRDLVLSDKEIYKFRKELQETLEQVKKARKAAKVMCPFCKKEFSVVEGEG